MIESLIQCLQPYQEVNLTVKRLRSGVLITLSDKLHTVSVIIKDTDSREYIRLTIFDMLDDLGYTPPEVKACDDIL